MHHRPLDHTPAILAQNRQRYERLVEMARHHAGRNDTERLLRSAMLAANFAWLAPVGLLSDLRLERLVVRSVRGAGEVVADGDRRAGRILHVLSEAYGTGGHTTQVRRWIERDDRTSDVVLTNQRGPVPERLVDAVRGAGGAIHDLAVPGRGLLDRARDLRAHMDGADVVVLTVHPYDVVALAAVNLPGRRPPVVYADHADLSFWLGVGGADVLCDWRSSARRLDVDLRGVPPERIAVLPLPVDAMTSSAGTALRSRLGLHPDAVVAVTVSADFKVAPSWGQGMHHVLERVLRWSPHLDVVLVGVSPGAEWTRLDRRYPGRVLPVGRVPDPAAYLAAADIYLDSYPLRSGTTPLEAAMAGLPVLALADLPEDDIAHVFHTGSPGLDGRPVAGSAGNLAVAVHRLVRDRELRRREGADVQASVRAVHDGPGWRSRLEALYDHARSVPAIDVDDLGESATDDRYSTMLLSAFSPGASSPDPRTLSDPLGGLFDDALESDTFAGLYRDLGPTFQVRVATGWEDREAWTTRLLELGSTHPRLSISLPFAAGDGPAGEVTVDRLTALLARIGRTPEDCGDVSVDDRRPPTTGPMLTGELPSTDDALDRLDLCLRSPMWSAPAEDGAS